MARNRNEPDPRGVAHVGAHRDPPPSRTVLVVDDEADVLTSTSMLIERLGYSTIQLQSADQVPEIAQRERPGLILQDLKMPGLSVAGLVASLRSNPATADIPLVFFSASEDLPGTAARFDAWGYLSKPFGEKELSQLLGSAMSPLRGETVEPIAADSTTEIRETFHDYWNYLAALASYADVLAKSRTLSPSERQAVRGLEELLLKVEAKTERLRAFSFALARNHEPM